MLNEKNAMATIAVKDVRAARNFYEGILGFTLVHSQGGVALTYRSGDSLLLVYQSEFAGTNQATAATWDVGTDLRTIVRQLRDKGVAFEHYDMPYTQRDGDVHSAGGVDIAWFKDPDGNILSLFGA